MRKKPSSAINGCHSHGPITAEGKERSSRSALKHGLCAHKFFLIKGESMEDLEEVRRNYIHTLKPANPIEDDLVRDMTGHRWRLNRAFLIENNRLDLAMRMGETANKPTGKYHYVLDLMDGKCFKGLQRYQTRLENSFAKAVNIFFKIRDRVCQQEEDDVAEPVLVVDSPAAEVPVEAPVVDNEIPPQPEASKPKAPAQKPPVDNTEHSEPEPRLGDDPLTPAIEPDDWPKAA